jgi:hypothetical protein
MFTPGAATDTHEPQLEKVAFASDESVAATGRTPIQSAGMSGVEVPSLPAAATTTTFLPEA